MSSQKHSLLLVDDEPEVLFSLKGLLRREFDLHTAESGQQALDILAEHPIDIIMTDQRMPEMTGVELMRRVKRRWPHAIRIVFTGYADIKAVIEAINRGGLYRYITKPWDPDELIELLHEAAQEHDIIVKRSEFHQAASDYFEQIVEAPADAPAAWPQIQEQGRQLQQQLQEILKSAPHGECQ